MNNKKKLLIWTPRILGLLICSVGPFAFLPTQDHKTLASLSLDFFMQMLPALAVLIATLIGWKWKKAGSFLFFLLGSFYIYVGWGGCAYKCLFPYLRPPVPD